ncbi:MAG TPA: hypothetical protein VGN32_14145 [Ktedonobacterales bacterium]|nr:hypothetical protein [Ktedonobacterales bacterium]
MRGSRVRRLLGALGVVLALALAACGQTPADIPLIGSPVPTFTLAPAGQLNWQPHLPPVVGIPQLASLFNDPTLALAPSDSRVAYECVAAARFGAPGAQVWTTRDGASHWKRAADLVSGGVVDSCPISVDGLNPMRAVALTFRDAHDQCMACGDGTYINFLTEDGGATWAPVRGPADTVHQLARPRLFHSLCPCEKLIRRGDSRFNLVVQWLLVHNEASINHCFVVEVILLRGSPFVRIKMIVLDHGLVPAVLCDPITYKIPDRIAAAHMHIRCSAVASMCQILVR